MLEVERASEGRRMYGLSKYLRCSISSNSLLRTYGCTHEQAISPSRVLDSARCLARQICTIVQAAKISHEAHRSAAN